MNIKSILYFVVSTLIIMVSFEDIFLNLGNLYFANDNSTNLLTSLLIAFIVFIIGHLIIIYNKFTFNKIILLKCSYTILMLFALIIVLSDVIAIWAYLFMTEESIASLSFNNKRLVFSFILLFSSMVFLLILKQIKITENNHSDKVRGEESE